jgi:predicted  nucleic acid-binding Zn-ribbon protein
LEIHRVLPGLMDVVRAIEGKLDRECREAARHRREMSESIKKLEQQSRQLYRELGKLEERVSGLEGSVRELKDRILVLENS